MLRWFLALGLLSAAGCGATPDYAGTAFACSDGQCPSGFQCVASACVASTVTAFDSSDGPPGTDAPTIGADASPTPLDCQVSEFGSWSDCSAACGPGEHSRTRTVTADAETGGAACPALTETAACEIVPCVSTLVWADVIADNVQEAPLAAGGALVRIPNMKDPDGVTIDRVNNWIYVADPIADIVERVHLDGTGRETVYSGSDPRATAIDPVGAHLFITDSATNSVVRANLDGSAPMTFASGIPGARGIAVDPVGRRLYVSDAAVNQLRAFNLDTGADLFTLNGVLAAWQIAIDVPGGRVYWVEQGRAAITSCALDGTNVTQLFSGAGAVLPRGIAVDAVQGIIYWTDDATDKIYSMPRGGGALTTVRATSGNPRGLAIY